MLRPNEAWVGEGYRLKFFGFLLRVWSYVFHLVLSAFLLGIAMLASSSHAALKLAGLLPFTDEKMITGVVTLGIIGLLSTLLAITGIFKYLFPVWTAIVLYLMTKGVIFSSYSFAGESAFKAMLWLLFGALGAFFGGLWVLKPRRGRL